MRTSGANGIAREPSWDIDIVVDLDGYAYHDICDKERNVEDPPTEKRYDEADL